MDEAEEEIGKEGEGGSYALGVFLTWSAISRFSLISGPIRLSLVALSTNDCTGDFEKKLMISRDAWASDAQRHAAWQPWHLASRR